MSEKKIVVPDGMLKAVSSFHNRFVEETHINPSYKQILEAALRWLSENPIVPTDEQVSEMRLELRPVNPHWANIIGVWQRRMFLAHEPEVPEAIKDLLTTELDNEKGVTWTNEGHDRAVLEAYKRGRESRNA